MTVTPLLTVNDLRTWFHTREGCVKAVDGVSFTVEAGQIVGLVGESGSGKSVTGFSILGLVDEPGRIVGGSIQFRGKDLVGQSERELRSLRGNRIAMIFQDPMMTLNPVMRVETQMVEAVLAHSDVPQQEARERAIRSLEKVGIPDAEERIGDYPHQFSGGMRQRVAIAIALLNKPDLIVADEPTTALDVTVQAQILAEIQSLCEDAGTALIWITHDLSVVAQLANEVCVMYGGQIVERGPTAEIIANPHHHYTHGLIGSLPSGRNQTTPLKPIPGTAPSPLDLPKGCRFRNRCTAATEQCSEEPAIALHSNSHFSRCWHPIAIQHHQAERGLTE